MSNQRPQRAFAFFTRSSSLDAHVRRTNRFLVLHLRALAGSPRRLQHAVLDGGHRAYVVLRCSSRTTPAPSSRARSGRPRRHPTRASRSGARSSLVSRARALRFALGRVHALRAPRRVVPRVRGGLGRHGAARTRAADVTRGDRRHSSSGRMRASADALRAYCLERVGATTSDEDGVSLAAFALDVREGRTTTRESRSCSRGRLTSVEPSPRARATEILVAIAREAMETLDDGSVGTLGAFFAGRLADPPGGGTRGGGAAACAARADETTIEAMARGLFVECDAQSLRQSDREACGRLAIEMLRGEHRGACVRAAPWGTGTRASVGENHRCVRR